MTSPAPIFDPAHRLSLNFTLREFTASQTATRRGIRNVPTAEHIRNMEALCREVLEPVRAQFGRPVRITSGYRSAALNRAVGGAPTSQHRTGEAADFSVAGATQEQVHRWIVANLRFDQLILYKSGRFHISYSATRARRQVLRR